MPMKGQGDPWGYGEPSLKRVHRRIFRINEQIARIEEEATQVRAELEMHRSIDDDAQRDAAIGNYIDREEAGLTSADVRRFERTLDLIEAQKERLVRKREHLLARLPD
ncbi:MAG: hypothetical protein ACRDVL_10390 [Acidimicrobiia bacterium]